MLASSLRNGLKPNDCFNIGAASLHTYLQSLEHHPYPLHLGGSNEQIGVDLPKPNHEAAHKWFRERGYGPGDQGRKNWMKLTPQQRRAEIRGSLRAAGLSAKDIAKIMKKVEKGAKPGTLMKRGRMRTVLKPAAVISFVILAPYDVYLAKADEVESAGIKWIGCESYRAQMDLGATGDQKEEYIFDHGDGSETIIQVVPRMDKNGNWNCYLIGKKLIYDDDGNVDSIEWIIPDDKSCEAPCKPRYSISEGGMTCRGNQVPRMHAK